MAGLANVCLFKDKECTQAVTLAELEEAFGKRQIIIRSEYDDGKKAEHSDTIVVRLSKEWKESVTPNIAYGHVFDFERNSYYTKEYFDTTS